MKIIINAYQYAPVITGTDRMAFNFLRELQKIDSTNQYYVLCSSENYIPPVVTAPNFHIIRPRHVLRIPIITRIINKLWRTFLPLLIWPLRADVYYSVHNMRLPRLRVAKRMIASNLDLIPLKLDEYKGLVPGQKAEIEHTARTADGFMSISAFSGQELSDLLGVSPDKITVIPLAADERFFASESPKTNLDLPEKFIFTLGGSEPRKNVQTITEAYNLLPPALQAEYPLLIAGGKWHGKSLESLKVNSHVRLLGYVSEDDLAVLYKHCTTFVFASRYEGFGFTILEAMASGTPVISANSSSLPEVAGDAALLFAPDDAAELSKHLKQVLTDPKTRQKLIVAGRKQTQKFSWADSAKKLHNLLTAKVIV